MMKKYQSCILCLLTGILVAGILLSACFRAVPDTAEDMAKKGLPVYLVTAMPENPYACAEITIEDVTSELGGKVNVSWKTFVTAQELQEYIAGKEKRDTAEQAGWLYYQCKLPNDFHALDLYNAYKKYDKSDNPLRAMTSTKGAFYRFSQESEREILVRDCAVYALTYQGSCANDAPPDYVPRLLQAFVNNSQKKEGDYLTGWVLDMEKLYWLDHEGRETTLENPRRTFTEIRGKDASWGSDDIMMRGFGMLCDAEYEVRFPESDFGLQVSFHFAGNIPATGYETYLTNGFCSEESYLMRVTDLRTGGLIQIENVNLCIEATDTVTFQDLNGDGFPDMKIDKPVHYSGSESVTDYARDTEILWDPARTRFEFGTHRREQRETDFYVPLRELPENAERDDYCVLTDSQGELYIPKGSATRNHVADGRSVYIAYPEIVTFQTTESNDIDLAPSVESIIEVYSHPVVNKMGENALTYDWENFVREVTRCSELCDGRVYNLNFERYHVEGGSDLYGYTFEFDAYDRLYEIAVFIRLEKVNMLETIGVRLKVDNDVLKDVTRYIGASFVDYGGELHSGYRQMKDNVGADEWDYPELHNMFSWAMEEECIYAGRPDPDFPDDCPVTFEEPRIERAVRDALAELWQLDDEERSAFENRPLMRSDLAVITRLECIRTLDVPSVLRIRFNGSEQEIALADKEHISYKDLGNLSGLKVLETRALDMTDYSFVGRLTSLRELTICAWHHVDDVDFLENLGALRSLMLVSRSPGTTVFGSITELSVLGKCSDLAYLYLNMPNLTDFSFLENLPEIRTIVLDGEDGVVPDLELLPNASYIDIYGKHY